MRLRGLVGADQTCERVTADDVRRLESDEARCGEVGVAQRPHDPTPVGPAVEQQGDEREGVARARARALTSAAG